MQVMHCRTVRVGEKLGNQKANNLMIFISNAFKVMIFTDGWKLALNGDIFRKTYLNHRNIKPMTRETLSVLFTATISDVFQYVVLKDTKILLNKLE